MIVNLVIAIIAFVGVLAVFYGLSTARQAHGELQTRLAEYASVDLAPSPAAAPLPPPANLRERVARIFEPAAASLGKGNAKKGKPPLQEQLQHADLKLRTSEYFMIQVGLTVLGALFGAWRGGGLFTIATLIGGLIGFIALGRYVSFRISRRRKAFNNQLGDTLILLANTLRAGTSFAEGIRNVAMNGSPPISDEFARAVREMNLGSSPEESLGRMVQRVQSDDADLMVTAVAIQRTTGGDLAEVLDSISYTIRERIRIKGQIATLTASASSSGKLITGLPIVLGLFMYFATPTYFRPMLDSPIGWGILGAAGFMIFLGNIIMGKITAIEV